MAIPAEQSLRLGTPVEQIPQVADRRAVQLRRLGIRTVSDLIRHLPARYEQEHAEGSITDLPIGAFGTARGEIISTRWVPAAARRRAGRFEATMEDDSGRLQLLWFNCAYLRDQLHPGMVVRVQGRSKHHKGEPQMVNPRWQRLDDQGDVAQARERLRPVYPATEDLPSGVLEGLVSDVLDRVSDQIVDPLAEPFVRDRRMPALVDAYRHVHMPRAPQEPQAARRRLAYNELLLLQLGIAMKRHYNQTALKAPALPWNDAIDTHIRQRFGFELTAAQNRVVREIATDLQEPRPMNRLLQGDVGSGKTVVALYALLMAVADRRQGALMAPTELLAEQHCLSVRQMLEGSNVRIALITAGQGAAGSAKRGAVVDRIASGRVDLVIGTQALLTESVRFHDLAVVVTDEQHRFGVWQRARFRGAASTGGSRAPAEGSCPHNLVMTATPIPRTLSVAVFGDLDISTIDQLPPGRTPITTRVVDQSKSDDVYRHLAKRLDRGDQAYVVVPTIDASGTESAAQLKNVREHAKLLQRKYCGDHHVATIHGQLKRQTRQGIMQRFRSGEIRVLVATTVIEVGVDVPQATIMVVEHAERFGLAQLHQLRGRVGRGSTGRRSLCVFVAEPATDEAARRMKAIGSTTDGFKIAEHDLQIRGMGEFFGTRQHGPTALRVARIPDDLDLLQMARRDAVTIIADDPNLQLEANQPLRQVLLRQYGETLGLVDVG